jgi:hypothetical protein
MSKDQVIEKTPQEDVTFAPDTTYNEPTHADNQKTTWKKIMPIVACGAGLFSDGYLNNVSRARILWTCQ